MPLPAIEILQKIADNNEDKTSKQFRKRGYKVEKLDLDTSGRRPDFRVYNKFDSLIVEVKTKFSADRDNQGRAVSIYEDRLAEGPSWFSPNENLKDVLENAAGQYNQLRRDIPGYQTIPFVLALFDESGFLMVKSLLKDDFFHYDDISAVIVPVRNRIRMATIRKLGLRALKDLDGKEKGFIGPCTFEWGVMLNKDALHPIVSDLFYPHIELFKTFLYKMGIMPQISLCL